MKTEPSVVCVTGASGHIGANLVRALLARGRRVRALVYKDERALAGLPVEKAACDITRPEECRAALRGTKTVFHCAGHIAISKTLEAGMMETNVRGTKNLVQAAVAEGVMRFIHFSSVHALSSKPEAEPVDETRPLVDRTAGMLYDRSKAEGERIVREAVGKGLPAVTLNPTAVIGPYDFKPSLIGEVLMLLARGRMPFLVRGGFNWVDARDVAVGALAAETRGTVGERYLFAGHWESVAGIAALVDRIIGQKRRYMTLPHWIAHLGAPFLSAAAKLTGKRPLYTHDSLHALRHHRYVSSRKAERELGFQSRSLIETVKDTLEWMNQYGGDDA